VAIPINYKKPRRINFVSVSLTLVAASFLYVGSQLLPNFLAKQEAYRALDEISSKFSGSRGRYLHDKQAFRSLSAELVAELRRSGVSDPQMETWIEIDSPQEVRFGVVYSEYFVWPFDVIEAHERVVELEYLLEMKR